MDGTGWMPTRTLLDVVWGLNSLFTVRALCVCVCWCVCICMCKCVCMCVFMYVCLYLCMYVCMCIYIIHECVCMEQFCAIQDLVNFDDPLNTDAAEQFRLHPVSLSVCLLVCHHWSAMFAKTQDGFEKKVKDYVSRYARK